ncbi:MAG: DUF362 domain-containing protein [Ruminococcaceae bacterium]|nr:DUF362 domain-containing protein [Oscillospiraceae bacterium]
MSNKAIVYFTRDLSEKGLLKIYKRICENLTGRIAVKLHTGEKHGPNIIPRPWVKALFDREISKGAIIETNTLYDGDRYTTEKHRDTLKVNGWTFCPVDIIEETGTVMLPVEGGKWFKEMSIGKNIKNYDSLLALTHFKGHVMGGFGGSNKNIGIGCADGKIGKKLIHQLPQTESVWSAEGEIFMERMTESTKSVTDLFGKNIGYINVLRNMSVSCDCEGIHAAPVVTPNIGICASLDILAVDKASVDLVYALKEDDKKDLVERIESRQGPRQLSYMKELGMGTDSYDLIDIDNDDTVISVNDAVKDVVPFNG